MAGIEQTKRGDQIRLDKFGIALQKNPLHGRGLKAKAAEAKRLAPIVATLSLIGRAGESKGEEGPTAKKYKPGPAHVNGSRPLPRPLPPSRLFSSSLLLPLSFHSLSRNHVFHFNSGQAADKRRAARCREWPPSPPADRPARLLSRPGRERVIGHSGRYTHGSATLH